MSISRGRLKVLKYWKRPDGLYEALTNYTYYSARYGKYVFIEDGQVRDGASGAKDILSDAWWIHDQLCADTVWADSTPCTPMEAAMVLHDILKEEGRVVRCITWPIATFLFGCKRVRKNA